MAYGEKYFFRIGDNSQMPPDFYLCEGRNDVGLLEVKSFNDVATPAFDIADFTAFQRAIVERPYFLDVDYLIFSYSMDAEGVVRIKHFWLKKVWEICKPMKDWPLNLQIKANVVHKIRPCVWYREPQRGKMRAFATKEEFLSALEETVYQNPKTHGEAGRWKADFLKSYKVYYGETINIPRWGDIKDTFIQNKV